MGPELDERPIGGWRAPGPAHGFIAGLIASAAFLGVLRIVYWAGTIDYEVRHMAEGIERGDQVEKRLDGIEGKLDLLIRRGEPKAGGN